MENRSGTFVKQPPGYVAFIPKDLPVSPPIKYDDELHALLSDADRKLGMLEGTTRILPNPMLFVSMYIRKEALLSSQIEGTQASFVDILDPQQVTREEPRAVFNYVDALSFGLKRLKSLPLSLRLLKEIHGILLATGRGSKSNPGEFRTTQNWIGFAGSDLNNAYFVPPPPYEMMSALGNLEKFFYDETPIPTLIKAAIIHSQFETIHPFIDGNGRMGRLLITFWLCINDILSEPLLYLSYYFKLNKQEYYDSLTNVRTQGKWEEWIKFFLKGVAFVSDEATNSAKEILLIKEDSTNLFLAKGNANHIKLLNLLFEFPVVKRKEIESFLQVTAPTAGTILNSFIEHGVLVDMDPDRTNGKRYLFKKYYRILEKGTELNN